MSLPEEKRKQETKKTSILNIQVPLETKTFASLQKFDKSQQEKILKEVLVEMLLDSGPSLKTTQNNLQNLEQSLSDAKSDYLAATERFLKVESVFEKLLENTTRLATTVGRVVRVLDEGMQAANVRFLSLEKQLEEEVDERKKMLKFLKRIENLPIVKNNLKLS